MCLYNEEDTGMNTHGFPQQTCKHTKQESCLIGVTGKLINWKVSYDFLLVMDYITALASMDR